MSQSAKSLAFAWLVGAVCALPAQADQAGAAIVQKAGKYFVVHCHGGDEALAEKALAAVERAWPVAVAALGVADAVPKQPLAVHLYRSTAGYLAADQQLAGGKFARDLALVHWQSRSAHVALQPPCTDDALAAVGIPGQTVEQVAMVAAHLARLELCTNSELHPAWFAEGLALAVGRQTHEAFYPCGGVDSLPAVASDMHKLQRMQLDKKLPTANTIVTDGLDGLDSNERIASQASFFRFLQGDGYKGKLVKIAEAVLHAEVGEGAPARLQAAITKVLGSSVDRDFASYVQKGKPKWDQVFRSLTTNTKQWHQIAFPNRNAVAWNLEPIKGGKFYASGSLRILPGGREQMNFLFGRTTEEDFYFVAFVAGQGYTVFHYDAANDYINTVGATKVAGVRVGNSVPFTIESSGKDLVVKVDGQSATFDLPVALQKEVFWGVGVQSGKQDGPEGSAGIWSDLTVGAKKR